MAWRDAVRDAATSLGGKASIARGGRDALARLATVSPHYSHLLVERSDAEGLFNALADLAREVAGPDTDMLVLGGETAANPRVRAIRRADRGSVIEALMADPPPRDADAIDLSELRAALDGARIDTRYQPIVRLADRLPVGLEALARLNHPAQGVVLPDRFIPIIEDAGLAGRLTDIVSGRALTDLAGPVLASQGLAPQGLAPQGLAPQGLVMALNFPLDVLLHPAALHRLEALRLSSGIAPERIIIELTESRPVEDFATLGRSLESLRSLGYCAAIDDVGPAVPRLGPLLELPFTSLKLDKERVQRVNTDPDARSFLHRTIASAKARGLTVVAEGVETAEIWDAVRALGADEAQGFLVARPLPLAAVPVWLEHWSNTAQP
ncbi:MAG TPA: EAL domain-containing protein [Rhodopila sp.]|nr:EAL domain-containing protein [Rhodopila sp.]